MLTHDDIWKGIDRLAELHGMSPSGLARKAGLDPTTFNKSKRKTKEGKARWPSTESLAKILQATGSSMAEFVALVEDRRGPGGFGSLQRLKAIRLSEIPAGGNFDAAGFPVGERWEEIDFPQIDDPQAYILELDRDLAPPVYRAGDLLVVSPNSSVRRYDRVLLHLRNDELAVGLLERRTAARVVLRDLVATERETVFDLEGLSWLSRIVWVSQ
ncbi:MAG TPA: helix-turn-helix transcriptional regulator [Rhodospirillales bacterium]|nr:helix-turn-helix transcriptional regulator [Rhodospirillales bacterium]